MMRADLPKVATADSLDVTWKSDSGQLPSYDLRID